MGIEQSRIINAVRVFVSVNPGAIRTRIRELGILFDMTIRRIPRSVRGISLTDTDITRDATGAFGPAQSTLRGRQVSIGGTFEDIGVLADVIRQSGIFVAD